VGDLSDADWGCHWASLSSARSKYRGRVKIVLKVAEEAAQRKRGNGDCDAHRTLFQLAFQWDWHTSVALPAELLVGELSDTEWGYHLLSLPGTFQALRLHQGSIAARGRGSFARRCNACWSWSYDMQQKHRFCATQTKEDKGRN
jgi:hypothetical protein